MQWGGEVACLPGRYLTLDVTAAGSWLDWAIDGLVSRTACDLESREAAAAQLPRTSAASVHLLRLSEYTLSSAGNRMTNSMDAATEPRPRLLSWP